MKREPASRSANPRPEAGATRLGGGLHNRRLPRTPKAQPSCDKAPVPRRRTIGELLVRTRCPRWHPIGEGDVDQLAERPIGPDLLDVPR